MELFRVNEAKCRKDGICASVCPVRIIKGEPGAVPVMDEALRNRCIACGHCMAFCPVNACSAPGLSSEDARFLRAERYPSPEQVEELVFSRRTIRNFTGARVPREALTAVLDAARYAPTGNNRQSVRWIVLDSPEAIREFLERIIAWLSALPDTDRPLAERVHAAGVVKAWGRGTDILTRNAPAIVIAAAPNAYLEWVDAFVALTYVEILAHSRGLGCCWSGYMTQAFRHPSAGPVREYLGLLPEEVAFSAQIVGYPRFRAVSRPPRKPLRVDWK
ncbi:MAG: nitroreductase family protein [Deltaproteobacteria bacterium]|jgi:nitroreductase/NAD-dependent dihydropyrimidine dehydrogenase PreA subunit|nr:nitroreductase family protein [Deltaproteobacteria bacterium]